MAKTFLILSTVLALSNCAWSRKNPYTWLWHLWCNTLAFMMQYKFALRLLSFHCLVGQKTACDMLLRKWHLREVICVVMAITGSPCCSSNNNFLCNYCDDNNLFSIRLYKMSTNVVPFQTFKHCAHISETLVNPIIISILGLCLSTLM